MIYLTINVRGKYKGLIVAQYGDDCEIPIRRMDALVKLMARLGEHRVMCSSSLDFPDEYTTNQNTIDLADEIRGNKKEKHHG